MYLGFKLKKKKNQSHMETVCVYLGFLFFHLNFKYIFNLLCNDGVWEENLMRKSRFFPCIPVCIITLPTLWIYAKLYITGWYFGQWVYSKKKKINKWWLGFTLKYKIGKYNNNNNNSCWENNNF